MAELMAAVIGRERIIPGHCALPPNTSANSCEATSASEKPSVAAISRECAIRRGAGTGVGRTRDQAPATWRMPGDRSGSPGSVSTNRLS